MIFEDDAIVRPIKGRRSPDLGPLAVLVATATDLRDLRRRLDLPREAARHLFISRLWQKSGATVVGPIVGAPYAVMILETLIAWGARKFLFVGWCGSLVDGLQIGEILVPGSALVDEGTSGHYHSSSDLIVECPSPGKAAELHRRLAEAGPEPKSGRVWSTDAVFRETPQKVRRFTALGADAVDMETSALFTVADFRKVALAAMLTVSDTLAGMRWKHGFRTEDFARGRAAALEAAARMVYSETAGGQ